MSKIEIEEISDSYTTLKDSIPIKRQYRQQGNRHLEGDHYVYRNPDTGKIERVKCHNPKHIGDPYCTLIYPDGRIVWGQEKKNGNWTGHYLCSSCYQKSKEKCRNKLVEKNSNLGKGFRIEMAIAKTLNIKNCNLELDNFNTGIDLYDPIKYKKIQSRSAQPSVRKAPWYTASGEKRFNYYDVWHITTQGLDKSKFDTLLAPCMDNENFDNIERMYAIPTEKMPLSKDGILAKGITIYKNPSNPAWYEKYRIDEKLYNETYHSLKIENCPVIMNEETNIED